MNQSKFFYLGKITRKFSFKGELIIFLDTDSPSTYYDLKKVYVKEDDSYLPYFISDISKYKNNSIRVRFEDIENESIRRLTDHIVYHRVPVACLKKKIHSTTH